MLSRSYAQGLVFIVLVALIWAASSVLVQYLYTEQSFESPFLLTYIGVSLFTLWLPTRLLTEWVEHRFRKVANDVSPEVDRITPYQNIPNPRSDLYEDDLSSDEILEEEDADVVYTDHRFSPWTHGDHLKAAAKIAPVWFVANWSYNASLAYTSITSSTVLAATGSIFTFIFALLLKDEQFAWMKLAGVLLGVSGSCLTALHDASSKSSSDSDAVRNLELFGDFLGLISAVGYGAYAVQTRVLCPRDEALYSMQLLLGYIGLIDLIVLSPIAIYQSITSVQIPLFVFLFVVLKGLLDNVISDYMWLRAVILTNATVATVGLGLTIPLAFASDIILGKSDVLSTGSVLGALIVLLGFVFVNIGATSIPGSDSIQTRRVESADEESPAVENGDVQLRSLD
jgi:solute carrier family 35 protein F5